MRAASAVALTALPFTVALAVPAHAVEKYAPSHASPCAFVAAPTGYVCVPAPKQCITTPCPQYDIVPLLPERWSGTQI